MRYRTKDFARCTRWFIE